ncbi:hypothetical protein [Hyphomicrobium sp.]|uniref:hypothetical protein n=1 Tax=Hyphomicrobium sp. TaxID=82 RepID=UPI003F71B7F7
MRPARPPNISYADGFFIAVGALAVVALLISAKAVITAGDIADLQILLATLPDVATASPGQLSIIDGRISASVVPLHDEFVVYRRERRERGWRDLDGGKQPLEVDTVSGRYLIGNDDYELDRTISRWTDSKRDDEHPRFARGSVRIEGLVANGSVMAMGRLKDEAGRRIFHADRVVGLSRATFAERLAEDHVSQTRLAMATGAFAALGIAISGWPIWRLLRGV